MRTAITLPSGLLGRIGNSLGPRIEAVRPLPATGILVAGLAILIALVAIVGAWRTGFAGFAALPAGSRWAIFGALGTLGCVAAARAVAEWIPGSPARLGSAGLLTLVCFTLLVLFGLLFRDHTTTNFMAAGIACLTTGLIWTVPGSATRAGLAAAGLGREPGRGRCGRGRPRRAGGAHTPRTPVYEFRGLPHPAVACAGRAAKRRRRRGARVVSSSPAPAPAATAAVGVSAWVRGTPSAHTRA